jgi:hypothetical protein
MVIDAVSNPAFNNIEVNLVLLNPSTSIPILDIASSVGTDNHGGSL